MSFNFRTQVAQNDLMQVLDILNPLSRLGGQTEEKHIHKQCGQRQKPGWRLVLPVCSI